MTRFPLCWPTGWKRTERKHQKSGHFSKDRMPLTITRGVSRVLQELQRLGIDTSEGVIISSNLRVRKDGGIIGDQKKPDDVGVAVYWISPGQTQHKVMATDRYDRVEDNLGALAATLEAMRAIERHGGAVILERAFTGFLALPAPNTWRAVLGYQPYHSPELAEVRTTFRMLIRQDHPDTGGSGQKISQLQWAMGEAEKELGA